MNTIYRDGTRTAVTELKMKYLNLLACKHLRNMKHIGKNVFSSYFIIIFLFLYTSINSIINRFGDDGSSTTYSNGSPGVGVNYPTGSSTGYNGDYHNGAGQYDTNSNHYGSNSYDDHINRGDYNAAPQYSAVSASSSLQSNGGPVVFKTEQSVTSNKPNPK